MAYIALFLAATAALCFGAYKLALWSDFAAIFAAIFLMPCAWYLLTNLDTSLGDGAPTSAAIVPFAIGVAGIICLLLTAVVLGTAYWQRRSPVVGVLLGLGYVPFLIVVATRAGVRPHRPEQATERTPSAATEPRSSETEGYIWAMDNGIATDAECVGGKPEFITGCKRAVAKVTAH